MAAERAARVKQKKQQWATQQKARIAAGKPPTQQPTFKTAQLSPTEKLAIKQSVRPATILDYLYRLRARCNYEDATMFVDGPEYPGQSSTVNRIYRDITGTMLFVHESHILRRVGKSAFDDMVKDWSVAAGLALTGHGVLARRDHLTAVAK